MVDFLLTAVVHFILKSAGWCQPVLRDLLFPKSQWDYPGYKYRA